MEGLVENMERSLQTAQLQETDKYTVIFHSD